MTEADSCPRSVPTRSADKVPNGPLTAVAAVIGAIACFMPWYRVDLAAVPAAVDAAFRDMMGAPMPGMDGAAAALGGVFASGGISGVVTAAGVDGWIGITALFALGLCATLHLAESFAATAHSRSLMLVGALLLAVVGSGCTLYGLTQLGGPVGVHVGLVISAVGALGAAGLSVTRMQANETRAS